MSHSPPHRCEHKAFSTSATHSVPLDVSKWTHLAANQLLLWSRNSDLLLQLKGWKILGRSDFDANQNSLLCVLAGDFP